MLNIVKKAKYYDQLKKLILEAVQEGIDLEYFRDQNSSNYGKFYVYCYLKDEISKMEGECENTGLTT